MGEDLRLFKRAGNAEELFRNPKTDYTRALFAAAFKLETAPEGVVEQ